MKKIFYLAIIFLVVSSTSLALGDTVCGLPMFRIASMHETTFGSNERYRITSYFIPDSSFSFNTASTLATIEWDGDQYTYVWTPEIKMVSEGFDRLMLAILYPTQAIPLALDLLENVTYSLTVGNDVIDCEFSIPENSFSWLDIPYATYDHTTRIVRWTSLSESEIYYSVRIYPPLLDGTPNLHEPLFARNIDSGETHFTLPNAAPAFPGYFVAVQAVQISSSFSANFSRDFIKIPVVYTYDGKVVIQGN